MRVRSCLERSEKTGVVFLASQRLIRKLSRTQSCLFTRKFAFSLSLSSLTFKFVCWPELLHSPCLHSHSLLVQERKIVCGSDVSPFWQVMFQCLNIFLSNFFETVDKEVSVDREESGGTVNFRQFLLATNMFKLNIFQQILKGFKFEEIMFMF